MTIERAFDRILSTTSARIERDEPLARHTTYRIGGPAKLFLEPDTVADLAAILTILSEEGVEHTILGKGSNILVSDGGYDGAIIVLGPSFRKHRIVDEDTIVAGGGANLGMIVRDAFSAGLCGLELAVGIPGTFGGALAGNVGTRDDWISTVTKAVTVLTPAGLKRIAGGEIAWGYRTSNLPTLGVIVEGELKLKRGDSGNAQRAMEARLKRRKKTQPLSYPNAGSVFRNPENDSAGRLIESCGLKGFTVGGAQISDLHANFIVNIDNATAADVVELITLARNTVKKEYDVELRPEIKFLGTF